MRGNEAFAYAYHKRLVEEMLARWRTEHPELKQVVLRIGTILGETVHNQITDLFEKPRLIADQRFRQPVRIHLGSGRGGQHPARDLNRTRPVSIMSPETAR